MMRVLCQQKRRQLGQEARRGHHFQALHAGSKQMELLGACVSCPSGRGRRASGRGQTLSPCGDSSCSLWRFPCWTSSLLRPVTLMLPRPPPRGTGPSPRACSPSCSRSEAGEGIAQGGPHLELTTPGQCESETGLGC